MIDRLSKVTVYVNSQDDAKRFWTEKMGFRVTFEQPMGPGATWLEVAPPGENLTSLVLYDKAMMRRQNPEAVAHPSLIFSTRDIEATWKGLKDKGVKCADVQAMPYGKMFSFEDNEGHVYLVREG